MEKRVVITGLGAVTPLGLSTAESWQALVSGKSGVDRIQRFDPSDYPSQIGAEVKGFDPTNYLERKEARRTDRFTQLAIAAAAEAVENARLDMAEEDPTKVGVIMGVGMGGIETLVEQQNVLEEKGPGRVSPFLIPALIGNIAAGHIAIRYGAQGPNTTLVTACASSGNAIGEAFRILERGDAEVVLAGGAEAAFVPITIAGFCNMKALSTRNDEPERASRPFDAGRDGFVLGEGASVLVLETLEHAEQRGAHIHAELAGYGMTADAYHITQPLPGGEGGGRSMQMALNDAGLQPEDIDYINAHGTSTPVGDKGETAAIRRVFGEHADRLAVSSTKSMTGHLLGAAGALELLICIKSIEDGVIPPTINYDEADPDCDLDYVPNTARRQRVDVALSNSFGFGGHNATLIVKRFEK